MSGRTLGWLLLSPGVALLCFVFFVPMYQVVRLSLEQSLGNLSMYVGLANFGLLIGDPLFRSAIEHTLELVLVGTPIITAIGFVFGILLFEQRRAQRTLEYLIFLPFVVSVTVIGVIFSALLTKYGPVNLALTDVGLGGLARDWLGNPSLALPTIGAIIIWQQSSFTIILFYSRLLTVPRDLYEAARLDGASWWQMHWHVTLPEVRSVMSLGAIIAAVFMTSQTFPYVFVITGGGPGSATLTTDLYIYNNAFSGSGGSSLAAAASVLVFGAAIAIGAVAVITRRLRQRFAQGVEA